MAHLRIVIEYDGTNYSGWQIQPGMRTIQEEITNAISQISGENVKLIGAGRTDAGVHAFGQNANFELSKEIEPMKFLFGLNAVTPDDIAIKSLQEVETGFDSRRDATSRIYSYRIHLGPTALNRLYSWQINFELDVDIMNDACKEIKGEHNFSAFCVQKSLKDNNNCIVVDASWKKIGYEYLFTIEANRFLHGMVRSLVGCFVEIGKGNLTNRELQRIIIDGSSMKGIPKAPSRGLCLVKVNY
ncbi:MAG: tRNA pseudouridine(38-40) synthase TruA [candidate division Zixibacteria bacterium]|nr:tRNA pseudouridine(38-40) synthase TruA [candidate division Zixibacteria bacterium]